MRAFPIINVQEKCKKTTNGYNKKRYIKSIKYIMIHHSGSNKLSIENLIHSHTVADHKWSNVGYHFYITKDEIIYQTASLNDIVNGCKDFNSNTIHICFEGNYEYDDILIEIESILNQVIWYLPSHCRSLPILMHSERKQTKCCGKNLAKFIVDYRERKKLKQASIWLDIE